MALTSVPASLSATALTLTTAAQPNITSVGTLTGLTVSGNIAGTLTTAVQTNITSVGTLSSLTVSGNSQLGSVDIYDNGALGVVAADIGHDLELRGRSSQAVNIVSGGTTTAVFDASGKVGIGVSTSLSSTLNVNTEISVGPDANNRGIINYSSNTLSFGTRQSSSNYFSTVNITGGKVGIGTASINSDSILHLKSVQPNIYFEDTDDSKSWRLEAGSVFKVQNITTSTEVFRIDQNNNFGIGVVPETWQSGVGALQVGLAASLAGNKTNPSRTYLNANAYINSSNVESYVATDEASQYFQNAGTHLFKVAASGSANSAISWTTPMTIDNSGNIFFGNQTDTTLYSNTSGGGLSFVAANRLDVARDGDVVATFNRSSGAGQVIQLYQGGSLAGGLGVSGTDATIGTGDTGITFEDAANAVHPVNYTTGAARDNAVDLGKSAARFKDLYLSGNVVAASGKGINFSAVAGVGAVSGNPPNVNTTSSILDDYEEGTFTANIRGQTTAGAFNYTLQQGRYTKIGRSVNITMTIYFASRTQAPAGNIQILLPFTASSGNTQHAFYVGWAQNITFPSGTTQLAAYLGGNSHILYLRGITDAGSGGVVTGASIGTSMYLIVSGTYYV